MSLMTKGIGFAKKIKHGIQDKQKERAGVYLCPARRIERVATTERVCAMTFDDGPCRLPASDGGRTEPLTLTLVNTLEKYGAKGTFDVIGSTAGNYPDVAGKEGNASWGGITYDHYPDINKDADGGAENCPELIGRILSGGHEITSHTYSHVLFGHKPLVYGKRQYLGDITLVVCDLERLHSLMLEKYGYKIRLARPPHYVDKISSGLTSYDAYAFLGYQYMAASFDGAGWLPLADYGAEVDAMTAPLEKALSENPDALCGQIIFQKDGYNMARRTPVADGLERQLELLAKYGYRIVTVSELLELSQFTDVPDTDPLSPLAKKLLDDYVIAYSDNTLRPAAPLTRGELCMAIFGKKTVKARIDRLLEKEGDWFKDVPAAHPYGSAIRAAVDALCIACDGDRFSPDAAVSKSDLSTFFEKRFSRVPSDIPDTITHETLIRLLSQTV